MRSVTRLDYWAVSFNQCDGVQAVGGAAGQLREAVDAGIAGEAERADDEVGVDCAAGVALMVTARLIT